MKKTSILFLTIISLSCFGLGVNSAIGKNKIDNELAAESSDAIMNAQTNPKNVKGIQNINLLNMTEEIFLLPQMQSLLHLRSKINLMKEKFWGLIFIGTP